MIQMVGAHDLSTWISSLPSHHSVLVACILDEGDTGVLPADVHLLCSYGYACSLIGEMDRAVLSYRQALSLSPSNAHAKLGLEYALDRLMAKP
jgi:hypothetical protein